MEDFHTLTDEQKYAFHRICSKIVNWKYENKEPIILDANGGSGKSFLIRTLSRYLNDHFIEHKITAFTGRACAQIAKSGLLNTITTHALTMTPDIDHEGNLIQWIPKTSQEIEEVAGRAIIVDEGSMLPSLMWDMFSKLNIPIIIVGDNAQNPSIEPEATKGFNAMELPGAEKLTLTRNFRQEEGSGIADLAMHLRDKNSIPRKKSHDVTLIRKSEAMKLGYHKDNRFDVVICGTNATRKKLNNHIRRARGFEGELPEVGETVICKRNDVVNDIRINNGELYRVDGVFYDDEVSRFYLTGMDSNKSVQVNVLNESWDMADSPKKHKGKPVQLFTFGYAVTCHAAQGSQFDNVLYIDEDVSFFLDQQRFRYTAVSRAAKELTITI